MIENRGRALPSTLLLRPGPTLTLLARADANFLASREIYINPSRISPGISRERGMVSVHARYRPRCDATSVYRMSIANLRDSQKDTEEP